ncbi:MAG: TadE/TadG family type IV pilus assembly protein [Pseudomonadota bacterium]
MNLSDLLVNLRLPRLRRLPWSRLGRDKDGISAVEFALIAPVLVCFYFGCIEISTMLITDRKVTSTAASVGDLVARLPSIDTAEMNDIFNSSVINMAPNDLADTRIRVTSIEFAPDGVTPVVGWSRSTANWSAFADGDVMTVPAGIIPTDGSVVFTQVEFDYGSITGLFDPNTGFLFDVSRTMNDSYYARPRRVDIIPFT